jgi:hypothetical protein
VRESAAFSLGRVCEFHSTAIPSEHLPALLSALVQSLQDQSTKVAVQGCYSVRPSLPLLVSLSLSLSPIFSVLL